MANLRRLDEIDPTLAGTQPIAPGGVDPNAATLPQNTTQPPAPPPPPGGYDYEKFRTGWAYGGKGFGSQTSMAELQDFIKNNPAFASGVTMRNEKLYDPTGKYMFDAIGNYSGGDPSKMTRIALEGNSKPKLKKPAAPKPLPKATATNPTPPAAAPPTMTLPPEANPITTTGQSTYSKAPTMDDIGMELSKLFPNGMFNQSLVDNRVSSATDALERGRKSRLATNRAAMAERGILNSQDSPAMNRMDESLYDSFAGTVRDIYGDESANADSRMMTALTTAAGLTSEQARQVIDRYRADTERTNVGNQFTLGKGQLELGHKNAGITRELGLGNIGLGYRNAGINEMLGKGQLALGNLNAANNYNLGLGQLGLGQQELVQRAQQGDTTALIDLLKLYMGGAQSTQSGYK